MADSQHLSSAFLLADPKAAAQVLEALDAADITAYVQTLPGESAALALSHLSPPTAARCLETLDRENGAAAIAAMGFDAALAVVRLLAQPVLEELLQALPEAWRRDLSTALNYPSETVGAWMDSSVPSFRAATSVTEALKQLRESRHDFAGTLFLIDDEAGSYAGSVTIERLLRAEPDVPLRELASEGPAPLSNRATLTAVDEHALWDSYAVLPVIGRRQRFVGGLRRSAVKEGLAKEKPPLGPATGEPVWLQISTAYVSVLSALLRAFLTAPARQSEGS